MCYCYNSQTCDGDVDMCDWPTDVCFAQIDIRSGRRVDKYACFEFDSDPLMQECLERPVVDDHVSLQCCNDVDRCNEYLHPPLPLLLTPEPGIVCLKYERTDWDLYC